LESELNILGRNSHITKNNTSGKANELYAAYARNCGYVTSREVLTAFRAS